MDQYSNWRRVLPALCAIALLLLGIVIGRSLAPGADVGPGAASPSNTLPGSRQQRSQDGALETAAEFARTLSGATDDVDTYMDAVLGFASPEWQSEASRLARNTLRFVANRYGDEAELSFAPIRYRFSSYTEDRAVVALWGVTVATGPKLAGFEESWVTGTIHLRWVSGRWLVVDQESQSGPTPELLRSTDDVAPSVLRDFKEYEGAMAS